MSAASQPSRNFLGNAWHGRAPTWKVFVFLVVAPWVAYVTAMSRLDLGDLGEFFASQSLWITVPFVVLRLSVEIFGAICLWRCAFRLRWQPLAYSRAS